MADARSVVPSVTSGDLLGGADQVVTLSCETAAAVDHGAMPRFLRAWMLPAHGLMPLQLAAHVPGVGDVGVLQASPLGEALSRLREATSLAGYNAPFTMGAALLAPFANRWRGTLASDGTTLTADVLGRAVTMRANGVGFQSGTPVCALHGFILHAQAHNIVVETLPDGARVTGRIDAGDFGRGWPSSTRLVIEQTLTPNAFTLRMTAENVGDEPTVIGMGWHPYFVLPSGDRAQARLHVPARRRALVGNYDTVLPTGETVSVAETAYDFSAPSGAVLGEMYLDDCFVDLVRTDEGAVVTTLIDAAARYGVRMRTTSPHVQAVQVYSSPAVPSVAVEPQFNWADPFGTVWPDGTETGMARLAPGEQATYDVRVELFTPC